MNLRKLYTTEVLPKLREQFGYRNALAAPRLQKVTVNVGVGRISKESAQIDAIVDTLKQITGQTPVLTRARKSIASFKIREGAVVGVTVTLRRGRMYDFLTKLIHVTLPRTRDFRGLNPKAIDRQGNLTIGIREHLAFPEVKADEVGSLHGLEICVTTTARTREEGMALLFALGFPFARDAAKKS